MFFAPPKPVETRVYATLPEHLKTSTVENEWVKGQPIGNPVRSLLEGPSIGPDGTLYCVDVVNGRIFNILDTGEFRVVAQYDGWPNGLKFNRDGRALIADYKHGIMELDPVNGSVKPYLTRFNIEPFKGVNDLFFAANGDLYFTDQGMTGLHDPTGRLFRVGPNGRIDCLLDNVPSPNGLVMNLEEDALYLAATRANAIWRVPLLRNGGIGKVGTFIQMSGGGGPDGLAIDSEGRLFIAHVGLGTVWVVDRVGEPVYRIKSCAGSHTTNVAFGGPDYKTLFITESSSAQILHVAMDVSGKPMFLMPEAS